MEDKNEKPVRRPGPKPKSQAAPKAAVPEKPKAVRHEVLAEITYSGKMPGKGSIVEDIPEDAARWLLEHNYIRVVED